MERRSIVQLILITMLLVWSSSGCGGEADRPARGSDETRSYTVEEVRAAFSKATGYDLLRASSSAAIPGVKTVQVLSSARFIELHDGTLRLEYISEAIKQAYGEFAIFVFKDQAARDDRIAGDARGPDGIYWSRELPERGPNAFSVYWVAQEPYGSNVLLTWTSLGEKKRLISGDVCGRRTRH